MEMTAIDQALRIEVGAFALCLAVLKVADIEGSVIFVHSAPTVRILPISIELALVDLAAVSFHSQFFILKIFFEVL
jgi:hypothetical protein